MSDKDINLKESIKAAVKEYGELAPEERAMRDFYQKLSFVRGQVYSSSRTLAERARIDRIVFDQLLRDTDPLDARSEVLLLERYHEHLGSNVRSEVKEDVEPLLKKGLLRRSEQYQAPNQNRGVQAYEVTKLGRLYCDLYLYIGPDATDV